MYIVLAVNNMGEYTEDVVSEDRMAAIEQYMIDFETMSPWKMR